MHTKYTKLAPYENFLLYGTTYTNVILNTQASLCFVLLYANRPAPLALGIGGRGTFEFEHVHTILMCGYVL